MQNCTNNKNGNILYQEHPCFFHWLAKTFLLWLALSIIVFVLFLFLSNIPDLKTAVEIPICTGIISLSLHTLEILFSYYRITQRGLTEIKGILCKEIKFIPKRRIVSAQRTGKHTVTLLHAEGYEIKLEGIRKPDRFVECLENIIPNE